MDLLGDKDLVIVPAWNEQESLTYSLPALLAEVPKEQIVVIDDGSSDRTSVVCKSFDVNVLRIPINLGVGAAIRCGYLYAVESGFTRVIHFDADLQHKIEEIPELLRKLEEFDVVIGSRFLESSDYKMSALRRLASRLLCKVISRRIDTQLTDVTSGFRAAKGGAIELFASKYPIAYLADTVESLVIAHDYGYSIGEVFTPMNVRIAGTPSNGVLKSALHFLRAMLVLISTIKSPIHKLKEN
jgi:glycosyltransferase involved in cell wall biosynthesis